MCTIQFNYSKLRGKIVEKYDSIDCFSKALGMSPTSVGRKLSGKSDWTQGEMCRTCKLLEIAIAELHLYFFTV